MLAATKYASYIGIRLGMITLCAGLALWAYTGRSGRPKRNVNGLFLSSFLLLAASGFLILV